MYYKMKVKKILISSYILIAIILLITFSSCENKNSETNGGIIVEVATITPTTNSSTRHYTGIIEESYSSLISFQVGGNIQKIYCDESQYVEKGQLLATLDKIVYQNNYDAAYSSFKQAEDVYNRMKMLYDNNSLPEIKWIEVQTTLQNARSMVNIANNNLINCDLYAPFSGVIVKRITETGGNVMPGIPVFNLVKVEKVKAKVAVPEKEVSKIEANQKAIVQVMALGEDICYDARIKEKSTIANPLSHTYDVKIELDNTDRKLMPGMICDVNILIDENIKEQIVVPNNSIMIDNSNNKFVWIVNNDIVNKKNVTVGQFSDHGIIIEDGLRNGDQIIVNGNQKVSEGMKIRKR